MTGKQAELVLTRRERDVLVELCRPSTIPRPFVEPASTRDIASALYVTEAAVKQHLLKLYDKLGFFEQGGNRRTDLANRAFELGLVSPADFGPREAGSVATPVMPELRGSVGDAHLALGRRAFREAFELFAAAEERQQLASAEDFAAFGEAALWAGESQASQRAREHAYQEYVNRGDQRRAAVLALGLVINLALRLKFATASGWLSKAQRHLERVEVGREHALFAATRGILDVIGGDLERGYESTKLAMELGAAHDDRDAMALGQAFHASVLQHRKQLREANALFDEAMVSATSGELGPLATGAVYCRTVCCCLDVFDYKRALEWSDVWEEAGRSLGDTGFPGDCRAHRATILANRGHVDEAISEAQAASAEAELFDLRHMGLATYELGELQLRAGNLELAQSAFERTAELGVLPEPGRSWLAFVRGGQEAAWDSLARAIQQMADDPLRRARLRPTEVDMALSLGRIEHAKAAQNDMETTGREFKSPALTALALHGRGKIALSEGRAADAVADLTTSQRELIAIEMPYHAAHARFDLGRTLLALGSAGEGHEAIAGAEAALRKLGAVRDADEIRRVTAR